MELRISKIFCYPLKGARGLSLESSQALSSGLEYDRDFMLVDPKGRFASQRNLPEMSQLEVSLDEENLYLQFPGLTESYVQPLTLPANPKERTVTVWRDTVQAWDLGDEVAKVATKAFGQELRLVRVKRDQMRTVNQEYSDLDVVEYSFADGYPYMVLSEASLQDLNERLAKKNIPAVKIDRFRPNILLSGAEQAFIEDRYTKLVNPNYELSLTKPCTRCTVVNVDQQTAVSKQDTLKTLMDYRYNEELKGATFGMNGILKGLGAGDQLRIKVGELLSPQNPR